MQSIIHRTNIAYLVLGIYVRAASRLSSRQIRALFHYTVHRACNSKPYVVTLSIFVVPYRIVPYTAVKRRFNIDSFWDEDCGFEICTSVVTCFEDDSWLFIKYLINKIF